MNVNIVADQNQRTEQNKIEVPLTVLDKVKNLIKTDRYNLFKIKSKLLTERKILETEKEISKLINVKKIALNKEKELETEFIKLKKENTQSISELKKAINL